MLVNCLLVTLAWSKPVATNADVQNQRFSDVFFAAIGDIVDHVIASRELHDQVVQYEELTRQGLDPAQNSRFKRQSQFPGFPFGSSTTGSNVGGGRPLGFSLFETMAQTVNRVDGMRCIPRSVCEMMANRGFSNSSFLGGILPTQAQTTPTGSSNSPFSLSNPSTLRSILGVMQLFRLNEMAAYPYVEAALWGTSHRDASRCRSQFSRCPESSTEGLISQLNTTPGGLQAVIANVTESVRPQGSSTSGGLPVSASVAETQQQASGGFFDAFGNFFPPSSFSQGTSAASSSSTSSSSGAGRPPTSASVAETLPTPGGFFDPFGNFFPFPQGAQGSSSGTAARPPTNPVVAAPFPAPGGGFFDGFGNFIPAPAVAASNASSAVPVAFNPASFPFTPFPPGPFFAAPPPPPPFDPFFQFRQPQFTLNSSPQATPPSNSLTRRQIGAPSRKTNVDGDRWKW